MNLRQLRLHRDTHRRDTYICGRRHRREEGSDGPSAFTSVNSGAGSRGAGAVPAHWAVPRGRMLSRIQSGNDGAGVGDVGMGGTGKCWTDRPQPPDLHPRLWNVWRSLCWEPSRTPPPELAQVREETDCIKMPWVMVSNGGGSHKGEQSHPVDWP